MMYMMYMIKQERIRVFRKLSADQCVIYSVGEAVIWSYSQLLVFVKPHQGPKDIGNQTWQLYLDIYYIILL